MNKNWITPSNNLALEIQNLSKKYKDSDDYAIKNISLNVKCGSFFGFLGLNGAGKSTLINIIGGTVIKTNGLVKIWDINIDKNRKQSKLAVGIVPQELNIDAFFTPKDQLELQAGLFNVPKKDRITEKLLKIMELSSKANSYSRTLSGGMRRRLLVAKALVHQPPLIILDEPTAGVDIDLRKKIWSSLKKINKSGVTIILTTHYLEEAEKLCDEIAIMHKGRIVSRGTKTELLSKIDSKILSVKTNNVIDNSCIFQLNKFFKVEIKSNSLDITYVPSSITIDKIISILKKFKISILDIKTKEVTIEDIFTMATKE